MPQFIGDTFGLSTVYDKQVENYSNRNYSSWPEGASFSYYGGTYARSSVERLDILTETITSLKNNLPASNFYNLFSVSSFNYGYGGNGVTSPGAGTAYSKTSRIDFSNETISTPSANFITTRYSSRAVTDDVDAFVAGGFTPGPNIFPVAVDKFVFATETTSSGPGSLPLGRESSIELSGNTYGYWGGGAASPGASGLRSEIYRIDFNSETLSTNPSNLYTSMMNTSGVSNPSTSSGYFFGGATGPGGGGGTLLTSAVQRIDYQTDLVTRQTNLPTAITEVRGIGNNQNIFLSTSPGTMRKFDFSNETTTLPGKDLTRAIGSFPIGLAARKRVTISQKSYGYFVGGYGPPGVPEGANATCSMSRLDFFADLTALFPPVTPASLTRISVGTSNLFAYIQGNNDNIINRLYRFDFSSETSLLSNSRLLTGRANAAAVSSHSYAYFGGGYDSMPALNSISGINRLDFNSETVNNPGKNLVNSRATHAGCSNTFYGYFIGGSSTTNIDRIDFSNETTQQISGALIGVRRRVSGTSSDLYGYIFGGDDGSGNDARSYISRLDFSNESISDNITTLPLGENSDTGRTETSANSSKSDAYIGGGFTNLSGYSSAIYKFPFSTESASRPPSINIHTKSRSLGAFSNSN
jgi:hypothetical protein